MTLDLHRVTELIQEIEFHPLEVEVLLQECLMLYVEGHLEIEEYLSIREQLLTSSEQEVSAPVIEKTNGTKVRPPEVVMTREVKRPKKEKRQTERDTPVTHCLKCGAALSHIQQFAKEEYCVECQRRARV